MVSISSEPTAISRVGLHLLILHKHRFVSSVHVAIDRNNHSMDPGIVSHMTTTRWFNRFKQEDYDLDNKHCSGRPVISEDEMILAVVKESLHQSLRDL